MANATLLFYLSDQASTGFTEVANVIDASIAAVVISTLSPTCSNCINTLTVAVVISTLTPSHSDINASIALVKIAIWNTSHRNCNYSGYHCFIFQCKFSTDHRWLHEFLSNRKSISNCIHGMQFIKHICNTRVSEKSNTRCRHQFSCTHGTCRR